VQEEVEPQRQTRGQGRRGTRQNATREAVPDQEDSSILSADVQESEQEQDGSMAMRM